MRPQTSNAWRKTLRREAKGVKRGRRNTHAAVKTLPRPGSTWLDRHLWMPAEERWAVYSEALRQNRGGAR